MHRGNVMWNTMEGNPSRLIHRYNPSLYCKILRHFKEVYTVKPIWTFPKTSYSVSNALSSFLPM